MPPTRGWRGGGLLTLEVGGALDMEVSLFTGDCSNVGITYTKLQYPRLK
jgi:hypothetical protein